MSKPKISEFKVGIFVFIAFLIVMTTIFWAKGFTVGLSKENYTVYFPRVSGINAGDQVSVNGVRKGTIDALELEGDSVKIKFNLEKEIKIKSDYNIYIAATELTGGKVLYIEPGKNSQEVSPETALHGTPGADFATILNSFSDITKNVQDLLADFKKSSENLNSVLTNINEVVADGNLKSDIKTTLSNLAASSNNLNQLVSESRNGISGITGKLSNTVSNIDLAIGSNSEELKNTLRDIQSLTTQVDTLVSNLNIAVGNINNKEKGIGKFLSDDDFYKNINKALIEIEKLTKNIRTNGVKLNIF
ncbi:MAG: hypothetical protein HGGPFJEG_00517 [Ignavibacteria bacterium]|nr:hypothetical protein [Ignavibacteria bacterium]